MRHADRLIGAVSPIAHGGFALPSPGDFQRRAIAEPSALVGPLSFVDEEPEGLDTIVDVTAGPARGIVLAIVPGLLMWGGLIAMFVRLMK